MPINDNLRTQFIGGKWYQGIRTVKRSEFENAKHDVKKCCDHWEKIKQYARQSKYTNQGHFSTKVMADILTL